MHERGRRRASRTGFGIALAAVVATVVLLPFAIVSLVTSLQTPSGLRAYEIGKFTNADRVEVNVDAVGLNELGHSVALRVTGVQRCTTRCGTLRIRLFSMGANPELAQGLPPSAQIDVPGDASEINADTSLPLEGSLASYPFDTYNLYLGITVSSLRPDGREVPLSVSTQRSLLALSFGEEIPRVDMGPPHATAPQGLSPVDGYGFTALVTFGRPLYLQILTILVIMLVALAATYAVLLRPFDQMIMNAGVIVLGMWGVRSLLVGGYPTDSTAVDLSLIVIVLILLLMVAVRGLIFLRHLAHAHTPGHINPPDGTT